MVKITDKDVLASISQLRGASVEEIAADVGASPDVIASILDQLSANGFVRQLESSLPNAQAKRRELLSGVSFTNHAFEVTPRGMMELRS